jgi:site-specific recombinase XerD
VSQFQPIQFIGPAYRNFIETVHSPFTRVVYKNSLRIYIQYRKIQDCNQLLEGDPKILQQQLIGYIIYLREECKLTATTINSRMAAIKKFYDTNDLELKWKKIKSLIMLCLMHSRRSQRQCAGCFKTKKRLII